jgi:acyl-CoA thioester hydrolase
MPKYTQIQSKMNRTEIRVYYADTDHGQVVYYANYLKWFEIGRTELLRQAGFNYVDYEKKKLIAPVVEIKCNYKESAKYNDMIIVETDVGKIGNSSIKFDYKIIRKKDKKILAEGYTVNVFINMLTRKPATIPKGLRESLQN